MNVLVTGGLGFIGSHFVRFLQEKNEPEQHHIFNIDKMGYGSNVENLSDHDKDINYRLINADINSIADNTHLQKEKIDAIVNFAAETHVDRSIADPAPFLHSNYYGAFRLLEFARKKDVKQFIQISTDEVYGEALVDYSYVETDSLNPSNPYSASKAAADLLVRSYSRTYGMPVIISRCTNNFGPNQFPEKLLPKTIIRILRGLPIVLYGNGEQMRDWLYVKDHVRAVYSLLMNGRPGEIYNIAAMNLHSNTAIVNKIRSIVRAKTGKETQLQFGNDRPGHDRKYSIDPGKIRREIGWQPSADFDRNLSETVQWYIENPNWWNKLVKPNIFHAEPWKLDWRNFQQ